MTWLIERGGARPVLENVGWRPCGARFFSLKSTGMTVPILILL
jgi:hypothetical protein